VGAVPNDAKDRLQEYKEGLAGLIRVHGKLETLRALETELHGTAERLQDERERALTEADKANLDEVTRRRSGPPPVLASTLVLDLIHFPVRTERRSKAGSTN
jgi:hypothetical protein